MKPLLLLTLTALICLLACQKRNSPSPTGSAGPDTTTKPSQPVDSILSLNLNYPDASGVMGTTYELIVSEAGGTILLDSIAQYNVPVVTRVKTKQSSVDVTTVTYFASYNYYNVNIYKAVQPAQWVDVTPGTQESFPAPATTSASKIYYTNAPEVPNTDILFSTLPASSASFWYDNTVPRQLDVDYLGRQGSNYAYLLFTDNRAI